MASAAATFAPRAASSLFQSKTPPRRDKIRISCEDAIALLLPRRLYSIHRRTFGRARRSSPNRQRHGGRNRRKKFRRPRLPRHPLCRAASGRFALEAAAAGGELDGRKEEDQFGSHCM